MKRVVITGIGIVSPIGTGKEEFSNSLFSGKSGIVFSDRLKELGFFCQIAGFSDIEKSQYIEILKKYGWDKASEVHRFSIIAALEAWKDAGLTIVDDCQNEVDYSAGIIIGSGVGTVDLFADKIIPATKEGKIKRLRSTDVEQAMLSGGNAFISGLLGLGNIVSFLSSACSTGTESIIWGYERIKSGKARIMIVGGSDACSPYCWSGFDAMRLLTRQYNDRPEKGSRPMSASASGFVPAGGAGVIVLEELESARNRKAQIYGEIIGAHINSGGQRKGGTMTAPNSEGVQKCIAEALKEAKIKTSQIDFISGHLTSTMADSIEVRNWSTVLNLERKSFPYIVALKSLTGHCLGASGAIEIIAALLSMKKNIIHPTINCEDLHPEIASIIDVDRIPLNPIEKEINCFAKASFGFGDVNSCIFVKKCD